MMAGNERRGLSLRVLRASVITAVAVAALGACSSNGTNAPGGPLADPAAAEEPPSNPQAALLNGEIPLPNPEQPPAPGEAPLPNPEQPSAPGGGASGGDAAGVCPKVCVGLGGVCGSACITNCGDLSAVAGRCTGAISAFIDCASRETIVCRPNGKIDFSDVSSCVNDALDATGCLTSTQDDTQPPAPTPGRGQSGN